MVRRQRAARRVVRCQSALHGDRRTGVAARGVSALVEPQVFAKERVMNDLSTNTEPAHLSRHDLALRDKAQRLLEHADVRIDGDRAWDLQVRSEERRVGKEWWCLGSTCSHSNIKSDSASLLLR